MQKRAKGPLIKAMAYHPALFIMIKIIGTIRFIIAAVIIFQYLRFGNEYFRGGQGNTIAFGILSVLLFPYLFYCVMKGRAELQGHEDFPATFSVLYAIAFQILFLISMIIDLPSGFAKKDYQQIGFAVLYLITFPFALYGDFRSSKNRKKI